jgi:hypothetical protein
MIPPYRPKQPAKPNQKAPLGQGGRFAALKGKLAGRPGVTNPGALAASIGRKKYGPKRFGQLSQTGRKQPPTRY